MSPTKSSALFSVSPEDWSIWSQQLQSETERGLATTAAAILEHLVARLIERFLLDDSSATKRLLGPFSSLSSFAARTAAAFSLGLISEDERDDLDCIREIRNDFAHQPTSPSFSDQSIADKVRNLKIPKLVPSEIVDQSTLPPRQLFTNGVSMLATFISIRTENNLDRRIPPRRFKIQSFIGPPNTSST